MVHIQQHHLGLTDIYLTTFTDFEAVDPGPSATLGASIFVAIWLYQPQKLDLQEKVVAGKKATTQHHENGMTSFSKAKKRKPSHNFDCFSFVKVLKISEDHLL